MSVWTKFRSIAAISLLSAVVLTPAPANADLVLPKTTWPVCNDFIVDYCIEGMTVQPIGAKSGLKLEWYPSGFGPDVPDSTAEDQANGKVEGPDVIAPGEMVTYTYTVPVALRDLKLFKFNFQGSGLSAGDTELRDATGQALVSIMLNEEASSTVVLEFWMDANADGRQDASEYGVSKVVSVGTDSTGGTGADETAPGKATLGRWSHPSWAEYGLDAYGYDGLTIDFKTANVYTNDLFFTVYPVVISNGKITNIAVRKGSTSVAANLDLNAKITATVRIGEVQTGITMGVANSLQLQNVAATKKEAHKLIISGAPVPVPQISNKNQCEGEAGIATAVVNTMQGYTVVENDGLGFGVDGLTGRMRVESNGVACGLNSPVWDDQTETLNWQASAPHFEPNGTVPNKGFYRAVIPANDALLLWGLADPKRAVTALTITVLNEDGTDASVASERISYLHGDIIINVTGFNFSKPKIQIKKVANFGGFVKAKTLTCTDPVTKKKVKVTDAYGCPKAPEAPVQTFVTSKFAGSASTVTSAQKTEVKKMQSGFIEAQTFTCTGMYKQGASSAEQTLAKKRASAVCNYAKSQDKSLTYVSEAKVASQAAYIGKVLVTMKDQK